MRPALLAAALVLTAPAGAEDRLAAWLNARLNAPSVPTPVEAEPEPPPRAVLAERARSDERWEELSVSTDVG